MSEALECSGLEGLSEHATHSPTQNNGKEVANQTSTSKTDLDLVSTSSGDSDSNRNVAAEDYFQDTVEGLETIPIGDTIEPNKTDVAESLYASTDDQKSIEHLSPEPESPIVSAEVKKVPGWKGWLRSASNSNANVFRLDLNRRTTSTESQLKSVSTGPESLNTLSLVFNALRNNAKDGDDHAWNALNDVVQNSRPKELLESSLLLRSDLPEVLRGLLWQHVSNSKNSDLESVFFDLKTDPSAQSAKQIQKDLHRMSKSWTRKLDRILSDMEQK